MSAGPGAGGYDYEDSDEEQLEQKEEDDQVEVDTEKTLTWASNSVILQVLLRTGVHFCGGVHAHLYWGTAAAAARQLAIRDWV